MGDGIGLPSLGYGSDVRVLILVVVDSLLFHLG